MNYKKALKLLLIPFIIFACCTIDLDLPSGIDSELLPYFKSFEELTHKSTSGVKAGFSSIPPENDKNILAYCYPRFKAIAVNSNIWNTLGDLGKEQVMFHELGHCAGGLEHIDTLTAGGCPLSIMYPAGFGDTYCYFTFRSYYINELKNLMTP